MGSRAPVQTPTGYAAADIEQAPIHDDMPIVDDDSSVGSDDDDDIVDDEVDDEEAQEDDLTLLAARSYGRKTQEQRAEGRARLVVSCACA